jgi:hypothetical protein
MSLKIIRSIGKAAFDYLGKAVIVEVSVSIRASRRIIRLAAKSPPGQMNLA